MAWVTSLIAKAVTADGALSLTIGIVDSTDSTRRYTLQLSTTGIEEGKAQVRAFTARLDQVFAAVAAMPLGNFNPAATVVAPTQAELNQKLFQDLIVRRRLVDTFVKLGAADPESPTVVNIITRLEGTMKTLMKPEYAGISVAQDGTLSLVPITQVVSTPA